MKLLLIIIIIVIILVLLVEISAKLENNLTKRALQKSHEKTQLEKWQDHILKNDFKTDQTGSLVELLEYITNTYLSECTPIILYDIHAEEEEGLLLQRYFQKITTTAYTHGRIDDNYKTKKRFVNIKSNTCSAFILILNDVMRIVDVIGLQNYNKVIIVSRSSQWRVYEFLASEVSQNFMNLLVITKSPTVQSSKKQESPYILYTHQLYIDALGSSTPQVLTSWWNGKLTNPNKSLFPKKIVHGFAGHRFIISIAHHPPFTINRGLDKNNDIIWDGVEVRLLELLSKIYNFTTDYKEAKDYLLHGSANAVTRMVKNDEANLGIAGLYITDQRLSQVDASFLHSQDCVTFISLASTALPRYRAIMGPFHWSVWLALTLVYLFAIFPLAFSDKHTFRHLIETPEEIENMFWYVFGTFTNCFTFSGTKSWSKSKKAATRVFIGFYWIFTIIITACYTGSIIAFVTFPVYPETVDSPYQLLQGRYQIGTLDKEGWQYWFTNSSDKITKKLFRNLDLVPDIESGLKNTTEAFFWPYAFMGSKAELSYVVKTNFTKKNKRALMHISSQCFVPFTVSIIYKKNSLVKNILDDGIIRAVEGGFMQKLNSDVEWLIMRSASGKLLAANTLGGSSLKFRIEDRALTLDDTQGMFLLLGAGFLIASASLLSEWCGGCVRICNRKNKKNKNKTSSANSIMSDRRSFDIPTPREKLDSIQYENGFLPTKKHSRSNSVINLKNENHINMVRPRRSKTVDYIYDIGDVFGEKKDYSYKTTSTEEILSY